MEDRDRSQKERGDVQSGIGGKGLVTNYGEGGATKREGGGGT